MKGTIELPQHGGHRASSTTNRLKSLLALVLLLGVYSLSSAWPFPPPHAPSGSSIHPDDLAACRYDAQRVTRSGAPPVTRRNPRFTAHNPFIIRNATVIDGDGSVVGARDISIVNGTIVAIEVVGRLMNAHQDVDLGGKYLTPGIVDMHSHIGGRSLPQYAASEDVTELAGPVTPNMKAIDGFDPSDEALPAIRAGGVTSSLLLTGASNLLSGQGLAIKMRDMPSFSVQDMVIQNNDPPSIKRQQYLKMACGENPKSKGAAGTRLGEAASLRIAYAEARRLREAQDDWCAAPGTQHGRYPRDEKLQFLTEVLRGDVLVNVHCYKTEDIEMMFRVADEAGFRIDSLHHASESYRMVDKLEQRKPLTLAIFGGEYGFKPETMLNSVNNGAILEEHGLNVSYVSDHPALNGQFPMREAAMAYNFGLSGKGALASLFAVPAAAIGLSDRLGYIREGYDADLVVWDDHPLQLGATPLQVWIDGEEQIIGGGSSDKSVAWSQAAVGAAPPPQRGQVGASVSSACQEGSKDMIMRNVVTKLHSLGTASQSGSENVVVQHGQIECMGQCSGEIQAALAAGVPEMSFNKTAYLLPGLTAVTPMHGLTEMLMEASTSDGYVSGNDIHPTHAHDALTVAGIHVPIANMIGITTIITAPRARGPAVLERTATAGFIRGVSMAFHTGIKHAADGEAFAKKEVAMHITLGHAAKNAAIPTIAGQIGTLRRYLTSPPDSDWSSVANGTLVLAVHADSADVISQLVLLQSEFPQIRQVIIGGAEAWMLADKLAEVDIAVVLAPWRCMALVWEQRRCHHGVPLSDETAVSVLLDAGVRLGLASPDDKGVRNMWWEAGWASKTPSQRDDTVDRYRLALDLLSSNVEEMFGLEISHSSTFSVWEGNPFEYGAVPAVVFDRGQVDRCYPSFEVLP